MASQSPDSDIRILLIGRTGHGKSSTGNTIVGKDIFEVSETSRSKTKKCKWSNKCQRFEKKVEVVDTPGIFDTEMSHTDVQRELLRALVLTTPGFHVIAFVLMRGRFTEEIQKTRDLFFEWFGQDVEKYACIILTDTDNEDQKDKFIYDEPHDKLAQLVRTCDDNVVPLNNKASIDVRESQVSKLFEVVEGIKQKNGNQHFSNIVFQLAVSYINSKCQKELSPDTVKILLDVGDRMTSSEKTCKYIEQVLKLSKKTDSESIDARQQEENSGTSASVVMVNEVREVSCKESVGNLPIYDSASNERIVNKTSKETINTKNPSYETVDSDCHVTSSDSPDFEVYGKIDDRSNTRVSQDFIHKQYYQNNSKIDLEMQASASDQSEQQCEKGPKRKVNRKDRKVDIESVKYETPVDSFKTSVNDGENADKNVDEFAGFLEKALEFCKRQFHRCILL